MERAPQRAAANLDAPGRLRPRAEGCAPVPRASIKTGMALGEFTKQIAQQALLSATSGPKDAPAAPAQAENVGLTIFGQIQAMQKALKEDEELVLLFHAGAEKIRVMEIFLPSPEVVVLSGVDAGRSLARAISPVGSLQLVVRVAKVQPGAKAARVGLVTPKAKDSSGK